MVVVEAAGDCSANGGGGDGGFGDDGGNGSDGGRHGVGDGDDGLVVVTMVTVTVVLGLVEVMIVIKVQWRKQKLVAKAVEKNHMEAKTEGLCICWDHGNSWLC